MHRILRCVNLTTQQVVVFLFTELDISVNMWLFYLSAAAKGQREKTNSQTNNFDSFPVQLESKILQ